jgi:hypothetical protein
VRRIQRALRRAFVEIAAGLLYGLQVIGQHIWTITWVLACTAFTTYWLTAWVYLIMDRTGR